MDFHMVDASPQHEVDLACIVGGVSPTLAECQDRSFARYDQGWDSVCMIAFLACDEEVAFPKRFECGSANHPNTCP